MSFPKAMPILALLFGSSLFAQTYLSDVAWVSATNGWGPVEKDMSNGEQAAGDGHPITLRTAVYSKGLGVHAPSVITYDLTKLGYCTSLASDIGVDDESHGAGSVIFQVSVDGGKLYDSGVVTGTQAAKKISLDITGKKQLVLSVIDDGDGLNSDHADWAGAKVQCGIAPMALTASWSLISGPGTVAFSPTVANGTATFSAPGTYSLRLSGLAGGLPVSGDMQIQVGTPAPAPAPAPAPTPATAPAPVGNVVIPQDAGAVNVKTGFGAKGDGVADDTSAIRAAMQSVFSTDSEGLVYFPAGTYLISDSLVWQDGGGAWHANLAFQGQGQVATVIKLKNSASGFGNPSSPKAVIYTASNHSGNPGGAGNEGYKNHILDLTVDTGSGNPGATGIDWNANNIATIRNVTIQSGDRQGFAGLDLRRSYFGPALVRNVTISGFDTAVWNSETGVSTTFEHITLSGQRVAGFHNSGDVISVRDLKSTNSVPAIISDYFTGLVTISDAQLNGGNGGSAIVNSGNSKLFARRVSTTGYASAVSGVGGTSISEYGSDAARTLFDSAPLISLDMPVAEFPEYYDTNLSNWASVTSFGANPNDQSDDATAIQAAIDSGKSTVYLPRGHYYTSKTIHVRGNVRHIIGFAASIDPIGGGFPAFIVESANNDILIERLSIGNGFGSSVVDSSPKTLAMREIWNLGYSNTAGAGQAFLDDTAFGPYVFNGQQSWARQMNPEGGSPKVTNNGGTLWLLDLKTETGGGAAGTEVSTTNGGRTELLGGYFSILSGGNTWPVPAFMITDSAFSGSYISGGGGGDHMVTVRQTKNGVTRDLPNLLNRVGIATGMTLYVGR